MGKSFKKRSSSNRKTEQKLQRTRKIKIKKIENHKNLVTLGKIIVKSIKSLATFEKLKTPDNSLLR